VNEDLGCCLWVNRSCVKLVCSHHDFMIFRPNSRFCWFIPSEAMKKCYYCIIPFYFSIAYRFDPSAVSIFNSTLPSSYSLFPKHSPPAPTLYHFKSVRLLSRELLWGEDHWESMCFCCSICAVPFYALPSRRSYFLWCCTRLPSANVLPRLCPPWTLFDSLKNCADFHWDCFWGANYPGFHISSCAVRVDG